METDADIHSTLTIDRLNQQAWEMLVERFKPVLVLSIEALELSENTGYMKGEAEALQNFMEIIIRNNFLFYILNYLY